MLRFIVFLFSHDELACRFQNTLSPIGIGCCILGLNLCLFILRRNRNESLGIGFIDCLCQVDQIVTLIVNNVVRGSVSPSCARCVAWALRSTRILTPANSLGCAFEGAVTWAVALHNIGTSILLDIELTLSELRIHRSLALRVYAVSQSVFIFLSPVCHIWIVFKFLI